jgi:uncharacterized protein (TIGR03437 family)
MKTHGQLLFALLAAAAAVFAQQPGQTATFGTVVTPIVQGGVNYLVGGASDLVLDEARGRLYLVNPGQRRVEVYSTSQRRFLTTIETDATPLGAAMARDGSVLYVTCHAGSSLNVIDLNRLAVTRRVNLPARPDGVAVGADEKLLITTIGTGVNNAQNILLIFDPFAGEDGTPIQNVILTPQAQLPPALPPPNGYPSFSSRATLVPTPDGQIIAGSYAISATQRALFIYEVASASLLRSRIIGETSNILTIAPDASKAVAGLRLYDSWTLQVLAQQNAANFPYVLPTGANLNLQLNQGGAAFSPDGGTLYTAINFPPQQTPPARENISQLLYNDPDNLLVTLGVKLPERMVGNMIISSDGGTIYGLSESGFMILPLARLRDNPIAVPETTSVLLGSDQCNVTQDIRRRLVAVRNDGGGRLTASGQVLTTPVAGTTTGQPPQVGAAQTPDGPAIDLRYNAANARSLGTPAPHDVQIVAPAAVNIPPQVRVYQNSRNAEAQGEIITVPVGVVPGEGLVEMIQDQVRQRLYIANSGMNRIEVFDIPSRQLLDPIKVGQLPRSLALTPDGNTLYVANTGGESITVIDAESRTVIGRVKFPPLPFNAATGPITPQVIAATQRGLQIVMNNGALWQVIDDEALPRRPSPLIGTAAIAAPRSMASTPNGEFAILLSGDGFVNLYDALADEYVQRRQIFTGAIQGYYGPVAAGPRGQYFLVNGRVLNQALSPTVSAGDVTVPGRPQTVPKPISAVAPLGNTTFARFAPPLQTAANQQFTDPPAIEIVDVNTGQVRSTAAALEGPLTSLLVGGRANVSGRTMAVDADGTTAFALTTSGISIVPLTPLPVAERPAINRDGIVNIGSQLPLVAQGTPVSIYGRNLGEEAKVDAGNWPLNLGGVCVTINNIAMPLSMTSGGQVNAHIPPDLVPGRYPVIVRRIDRKIASAATQLQVLRYAPAVLIDPATKAPAIYHEDGTPVSQQNPAERDDRLYIYAVGLGAVRGPRLQAGVPTPEEPKATTDAVKVFFDNPLIRESEMDVEDSTMAPGLVGVYRIQVYVPWYRRRGENLLVTVRVGNIDSPKTGPNVPTIAVR